MKNKVLKIINEKIEIYASKQRFYEQSGSSSAMYDSILNELYDLKNRVEGIEEGKNANKQK